ncbi:MAG: RNA polymerase sigma factor (sigma-70 family) [Roseivirga sp.]
MKHIEEKRLIKKCIGKDRLAQRVLYEQYKTAMFSTAYRITNDWDLANDVLQDGFIKVFENLHQYNGVGALGGWIKIIVVRAALKEVKGLQMYVEVDDKIADDICFDDNLTGELLAKIMDTLPDKCRVVFNLIEVEGYKHKEVASLLNIQLGTVKSQLHYAKKLLKQKLNQRGYERGNER